MVDNEHLDRQPAVRDAIAELCLYKLDPSELLQRPAAEIALYESEPWTVPLAVLNRLSDLLERRVPFNERVLHIMRALLEYREAQGQRLLEALTRAFSQSESDEETFRIIDSLLSRNLGGDVAPPRRFADIADHYGMTQEDLLAYVTEHGEWPVRPAEDDAS